jgi:hypothetical protein
MISRPSLLLTATAAFALSACGPQAPSSAAKGEVTPAAPAPAAEPAKAAEIAPAAPEAMPASGPVAQDFGDFGSDEPLPRANQPTRGVLRLEPKDGVFTPMDHWEQYDWAITTKRPGLYKVRLNYELDHATLGVQLKVGEVRLRKVISAAQAGHVVTLGELTLPASADSSGGKVGLSLYAPQSANSAGFGIKALELVPANTSGPLQPAADGSFTALAKDATTWSETMRYEDKPEKNCLGYWTDAADFAEWELAVTQPGKYEVVLTHGCSADNAGSQVALRLGDQEAKFTVQDTGGFQSWKDTVVGVLEVKTAGSHFLVLAPQTKAKTAVLDVQKVVLKPLPSA